MIELVLIGVGISFGYGFVMATVWHYYGKLERRYNKAKHEIVNI